MGIKEKEGSKRGRKEEGREGGRKEDRYKKVSETERGVAHNSLDQPKRSLPVQ